MRKRSPIDYLLSDKFFWPFIKVCGALIVLVLLFNLYRYVAQERPDRTPNVPEVFRP